MTRLTIELDETLDASLTRMAEEAGCNKNELVLELIRGKSRVEAFKKAHALIQPAAEKAGYMSDEDIFEDVS